MEHSSALAEATIIQNCSIVALETSSIVTFTSNAAINARFSETRVYVDLSP